MFKIEAVIRYANGERWLNRRDSCDDAAAPFFDSSMFLSILTSRHAGYTNHWLLAALGLRRPP